MDPLDIFIRLLIATVLGGFIGLEREIHGKEAGLRTYTLVSLGSALIMIVSIQIFEIYKNQTVMDPSRIAAQVVTGIGFLGAGAIIRSSGSSGAAAVKGLTTAAGIWVSAGIGLACGIGAYIPALMTTIWILLVLQYGSRFGFVIRAKRSANRKSKA